MALRSLLPGLRHPRRPNNIKRVAGRIHPQRGRFDELYGVYLPTHAERQAIFGIHLQAAPARARGSSISTKWRARSEGYTGADIKEVVQLGLKVAFHTGDELTTDHLLAAIPEVRPLSKTDPESVTEVTQVARRSHQAGRQRPPHVPTSQWSIAQAPRDRLIQ